MKLTGFSLIALLLPGLALAGHGEHNSTDETTVSRTAHHAPTGVSKGQGGRGGHGGHGNSTEASCAKLNRLESIVDLASNTTKLDRLPKSEQTQIQSLAANATTELTTLKSNATLVALCQTKKDCGELLRLEKLDKFLSNATTESEGFFGPRGKNVTDTELAELKANVTAKLTALQSNTTLMTECKGVAGTTTTGSKNGATATGTSAAQVTTNAALRSTQAIGNGAIALFILFATFMF